MSHDFPMGTVIPDGPARGQALEWIARQEAKQRRRDTCRFWAILIFTIIAAVAACIAAWPFSGAKRYTCTETTKGGDLTE